jgi:N-acetylglucosamine-6-phosphate deacetylase
MLHGQRIRVQAGRCVNDACTLAGAAITLADAVRIGIAQYGLLPEQALASATRIPAELLGLSGQIGVLGPGARADAVVFDAQWQPIAVMQGGAWARPLETAS